MNSAHQGMIQQYRNSFLHGVHQRYMVANTRAAWLSPAQMLRGVRLAPRTNLWLTMLLMLSGGVSITSVPNWGGGFPLLKRESVTPIARNCWSSLFQPALHVYCGLQYGWRGAQHINPQLIKLNHYVYEIFDICITCVQVYVCRSKITSLYGYPNPKSTPSSYMIPIGCQAHIRIYSAETAQIGHSPL